MIRTFNERFNNSISFKIAALGFCFFVYFMVTFDLINIPVDDVYISLRYVWNFITGNGLTFNPGEHVEGYSNPTWVFLISLIAKVSNVTDKYTLIVMNRLISFFVLFGSYIYFYKSVRVYQKNSLIAFIYLLILCSHYYLNIYGFLGMETPLVLLLLAIFFYYFNRYIVLDSPHSLKIASFFLGLLSISRPEGIIYIAAFTLALIVYQKYFQHSNFLNAIGKTLQASYISLLVFAGFLIFRLIYYGEFLPNTAAAKNFFDVESFIRALHYILAGTFISLGGFLSLFVFEINKDSHARHKLLFILTSAIVSLQLLFILYTGWDWMPGFRFILIIAPLLYFIIFLNLELKNKWTLLLLLVILVAQSYYQRHEMREAGALLSGFKEIRLVSIGYKDVSDFLNKIKNPDDVMLIQEAGYVPFATDIKTIDLTGLTDKHIASLPGYHFQVLDLNYSLVKRKPTLIVTFETEYDEQTSKYFSKKYFQSNAVLQSEYFLQNYSIIYYKYKVAVFSLNNRNVKKEGTFQ